MNRIINYFLIFFFGVLFSTVNGQNKVDTIFLPDAYITVSKPSAKNGDSIIIKAELLTPLDKEVILSFKTFGDAIENQHYINEFKNKGQRVVLGWKADNPNLTADIGGRLFVDNKRNLYIGGIGITKWVYGDTFTTKVIDIPVTDFTLDTIGNIYISNNNADAIIRYNEGTGISEYVAGGNGPGNLSNQLWYQWGVAIDDSLNLFVADYFNHRIQKWSPNAKIGTTIIGGEIPGTGPPGNGVKVLPYPKRIFIDKRGFLYVLSADKITKWKIGASQPMLTIPKMAGITYNDTDAFFVNDNGDIIFSDPYLGNGGIFSFDSTGKSKGNILRLDETPLSLSGWGSNSRYPATLFFDFLGNQFYSTYFGIIMNQISPDIIIPVGQKSGTFKLKIAAIDSVSRLISIKPVFAKNLAIDTSNIHSLSVKINCITIPPDVSNKSVCVGQQVTNLGISPSPNHELLWYSSFESNDSFSKIQPIIKADSTMTKVIYVSQVNKFSGCESIKKKVDITIFKPSPPSVVDLKICAGQVPNLIAAVKPNPGNSLIWYVSDTDSIGTTAIPQSISNQVGEKPYYVSQVDSIAGCISDRSKILVSTVANPSPPKVKDINLCFGSKGEPLKAIGDTGNVLIWYDFLPMSPPSFMPLVPKTNILGKTFVTVLQKDTITGCESVRSTLNINISPLPNSPSVQAAKFCNGDTAAKFSVVNGLGSRIKWYLENGDTLVAPKASELASGKFKYFVSQIDTLGCESEKKEMLVDVLQRPTMPLVDSAEYCLNGQSKALNATAGINSILIWYGTSATGGVKSTIPPIPSTQKEGLFNYFVSQLDTLNKCESDRNIITVNVNPIPLKPSILRSTNILLSSAPLGNQWLKNESVISGATDTLYKPTENGQYTVRVTLKNCISPTSDSYYFITTGLNEVNGIGVVKISPNPTSAKVFIESKNLFLDLLTLELYDFNGKLILMKPRFKMNSMLDLSYLQIGSYILVIKKSNSQILYQTQLIKSK